MGTFFRLPDSEPPESMPIAKGRRSHWHTISMKRLKYLAPAKNSADNGLKVANQFLFQGRVWIWKRKTDQYRSIVTVTQKMPDKIRILTSSCTSITMPPPRAKKRARVFTKPRDARHMLSRVIFACFTCATNISPITLLLCLGNTYTVVDNQSPQIGYLGGKINVLTRFFQIWAPNFKRRRKMPLRSFSHE